MKLDFSESDIIILQHKIDKIDGQIKKLVKTKEMHQKRIDNIKELRGFK